MVSCDARLAMTMWTLEKVEEFIELYEERPCLYNTTMKDYHNRCARKKAIDELATSLEVSGVYA